MDECDHAVLIATKNWPETWEYGEDKILTKTELSKLRWWNKYKTECDAIIEIFKYCPRCGEKIELK